MAQYLRGRRVLKRQRVPVPMQWGFQQGQYRDSWFFDTYKQPVALNYPYWNRMYEHGTPANPIVQEGTPTGVPRMLGEQLNDAKALMDMDPGVSALRAQLEDVDYQIQTIENGSWVIPRKKCGRNERGCRPGPAKPSPHSGLIKLATENRKCRDNKYVAASAIGKMCAKGKELLSELKPLRKRREQILTRLKQAEDRVFSRLAKTVPYKGHTIKPLIDRNANAVTYQLIGPDGVKISGPTQRLDEAKALVDNVIASDQQKAVQQAQEARVQAFTASSSAPESSSAPTFTAKAAQAEAGSEGGNTGRILLIGGAAAAALLLLR